MKRSVTKIRLDDARVRFRITLEGPPCDSHSVAGRIAQVDLLRTLAEQPQLMICGFQLPDIFRLWHNGASWQVDMESVEMEA